MVLDGIRVPRLDGGGRPRTRPDRVLADKATEWATFVDSIRAGQDF
ncbi:hypothetical protein MILUP08_45511 [Micromonospora lupini str. Lupac 08]|uniref:Uncharacterized protein n=1 Tax=Micromonospora lupini str. Lupac 08 TaxID=1150864 RepID=I0L9Y0_9ACTN|nr:hypothetical protein MILUP08_45511 [Micromonospora lupini str. Lupac 08]